MVDKKRITPRHPKARPGAESLALPEKTRKSPEIRGRVTGDALGNLERKSSRPVANNSWANMG
jgi:hypothetical protein